ncbi:hypothetical protein Patl1_18996 [Pistacia atlantica]|uniref:Uncharacterized protein n=1 Tax=Pistacia atlantica TaxID=434234 RepID=A0ACC1C315_9ROSI|nr:hypothetical protein Patl1_18996 [Pistacia atlantica]
MDEFTSRIEELNSKFSIRKVSTSQQNLALPAETCNGSGPTSLFMTGLANEFKYVILQKECYRLLDRVLFKVLLIARGQRQMMLQLDSISNILHEYWGERSRQERADEAGRKIDIDSISVPLILTLAIGGISIFLFKGLTFQK